MSRMLRTVFAMVMAGVVINVGCGLFPEHYSSTDFTGTGTGGQGGEGGDGRTWRATYLYGRRSSEGQLPLHQRPLRGDDVLERK